MPTNLPPEYFDVEKRYRSARDPAEKTSLLEEMLRIIPKHKGTDKLRADLRKRLSKSKSANQTKKSVSRHVSSFLIRKEGAGQVILLGIPNTGKSALLKSLTNANPVVSESPNSTWSPLPGMMKFEDILIQLIDTPPLSYDYNEPELFNLVRRIDLILLVLDLQSDPVEDLKKGIAILEEHNIFSCHKSEKVESNTKNVFKPTWLVLNKHDSEQMDELVEIFKELVDEEWPTISISAVTQHNMDEFKKKVFDELKIIRVYTKTPGKEVDRTAPFVLKRGGTVADFAQCVHKDFTQKMKTARIWGKGVYNGQLVQKDHVLNDGDIVELNI